MIGGIFEFIFGLINPLAIAKRFMFYGGGSGGGGDTTTTITNYSIPEWLQPQTETLLGAATQEYFDVDSSGNILGVKPSTPYSSDPRDYVAGPSPLQEQIYAQAAQLGETNPAYEQARQLAAQAAASAQQAANAAYAYGEQGAQYGELASQYGALGSQYGDRGVALGEQAAGYGGAAFNMGRDATRYGDAAFNLGMNFGDMIKDPEQVAMFMSPYMQNVVDVQKEAALRDAQMANLSNNLAAGAQGTYGGARQLLTQAEASRALESQLAAIQAEGQQKAYEDAIRNQLAAVDAGFRGAGLGIQGVGTGIQGAGVGIQGAGVGMQGMQVGMQGAQVGIQGAQAGMQGADIGLKGANTAQKSFDQMNSIANSISNMAAQEEQARLEALNAANQIALQQQAYEQAVIDQAVRNYDSQTSNAQDKLEAYSSLLHGYANPTSTVTKQGSGSSAASQIAGMGTALAGAVSRAQGGLIRKPQGIDTLAIRNAHKRGKK